MGFIWPELLFQVSKNYVQKIKKYVKLYHMKRKINYKTINLKWLIAGIAVLLLIFFLFLAAGIFRVKKVQVTGNSYYTEEEIKSLVMGEHHNSIYLWLFYNYMGGKEIPFVDSVEVTMKSPGQIAVRVYEKTIIGYVKYMGSNLYFDKDGTVVESSGKILPGVPCIKGLQFDSLTLYQPLKVEDRKIFELILSITQMMKKYDLKPDAITLKDEGKKLVLTFDKVRIYLGNGEHIDERAAQIQTLLPDLKDRSGVLHMEEYTNEKTNISFIPDKE